MKKVRVKALATLFAVLASMVFTVPQNVLFVKAEENAHKLIYYRVCSCGYQQPIYADTEREDKEAFDDHTIECLKNGGNGQFTDTSADDWHSKVTVTKKPSSDTSSTPGNTQTVSLGTTKLRGKNITYNSATLTWDKVSGAAKYEIQYKKAGGSWKRLTTTTKTSYTHKKLTTGGTYWYQVRAVKNTTNGKWSNTLIVKTSLDNIKNLKAKAVNGKKVSLTWKKVSGAKQYVILRSTSKNGKYKVVGKSGKASYTDKGLKGGKKYYYKVYAVSGSCKTKETKPVTVKTTKNRSQ